MSAGFKRELLILLFVKALLEISLDPIKSEGALQRDRHNKYRKINKKIDDRIATIADKIIVVINRHMDEEFAKWVKCKTNIKIYNLLAKIQEYEIQIEVLALYVMYINFCERKLKLDSALDMFTNSTLYFDNIDLIKNANIDEDTEQSMYYLAYKIIEDLR